jgi:hypothetical protein
MGTDVYVGGGFTTTAGSEPLKWLLKWDGRNWSNVGTGVNGPVLCLAVSGTDLYAGGIFDTAGGVRANYVAKWDGSSWSALGSGTNGNVYALAARPNGSGGTDVYAGGYFTTAGSTSASNIAKWDGTTWSALGTGVNSFVFALAFLGPDVYAGGDFHLAGHDSLANHIAKWNGTTWSALYNGLDNGDVYAFAVIGSDLYVGGEFTSFRLGASTFSARNLAKWNGTWTTVGFGTNKGVAALAVSGSDLIVAGKFDADSLNPGRHIAKWNGSAWSTLGAGTDAPVYAVGISGTNLYAGGGLQPSEGGPAGRVARWDGSTWSAPGNGTDAVIQSLLLRPNGSGGNDVYVGGQFVTAGSVAARHIAKWNGTNWAALGAGTNGTVLALASSGADLYAGGSFTTAGILSAPRVAKWNGSSWSSLGTALDTGIVFALATIGSNLYAGGNYPSSFGISKWNGSSWSNAGGGINGTVYALAAIGTDLYVGGFYSPTAGGVPTSYIAKWNGSSWSALGSGLNGAVFAFAVNGTDLYVGGDFTTAGGNPAKNIAKWDGTTWSSLGTGVDSYVFSLAVVSDSVSGTHVYAGGEFLNAGGAPAAGIARWDGAGWSRLGSGVSRFAQSMQGVVYGLGAAGIDLYAGGYFTWAGARPSSYFAHWDQGPPAVPFTTGWNMVSVPMMVPNDSVSVLFPGASSSAFAYTLTGYELRSTIHHGTGYWLKSSSVNSAPITGTFIYDDTIPVFAGWNLIGSIAQAIPVSAVTSSPPGLSTSDLYSYSGTYVPTDSIYPGHAYWIKVNGSGALYLSPSPSSFLLNRIRITPTSERPPSPPSEHEGGNPAALIPEEFALRQNYPNPFNPSTEIRYELPGNSAYRVRLVVFNLLGQEVTVLTDRIEGSGSKAVVWDSGNLAAGVYTYRLEAVDLQSPYRSFQSAKKMLLIR